jgi:hypothetical protein
LIDDITLHDDGGASNIDSPERHGSTMLTQTNGKGNGKGKAAACPVTACAKPPVAFPATMLHVRHCDGGGSADSAGSSSDSGNVNGGVGVDALRQDRVVMEQSVADSMHFAQICSETSTGRRGSDEGDIPEHRIDTLPEVPLFRCQNNLLLAAVIAGDVVRANSQPCVVCFGNVPNEHILTYAGECVSFVMSSCRLQCPNYC